MLFGRIRNHQFRKARVDRTIGPALIGAGRCDPIVVEEVSDAKGTALNMRNPAAYM